MADINELIKALRCSATPYSSRKCDCEKCQYRLLEPFNDKLPVPCDVEIDGQRYYESCDVDRIALDSADMLERLKEVE